MTIQIFHLSTSHRVDDNRILFSEAYTLSRNYSVAVSGLECRNTLNTKVRVFPTRHRRLFTRILGAIALYFRTWPRVVHLHDPEMIFFIPLFRLFGSKVVYDVHEDYTLKFKSRGSVFSRIWDWCEKSMSRFANLVVAADSHIVDKFGFHPNVILIGNFPPRNFATYIANDGHVENAEFVVAYVGTIHKLRGLQVAVDAIKLVKHQNVVLHVVGNCRYPDLLEMFRSTDRVVYHGRINWEELPQFYSTVDVGLALYQPVPAFTYYPGENVVKLFEYAAFGIPSILPDFEKLGQFISRHGGAVCVNSADPAEVAKAIDNLYEDREYYDQLSNEGVAMVRDQFNWEIQEQLLLDAYSKLL